MNNKLIKGIGLSLVALIIVGFAIVGSIQVQNKNNNVNKLEESEVVSLTIIVDGESKNIEAKSGLSLMEIMQENYEVQTQYDGTFISGIDSVVPNENEFLSFYINGEMAIVGALEYIPTTNDTIEFKLEEIRY